MPKGTLVIRAAEQVGIAIPRFCDHPLLAPAGACRQCLVEVARPAPTAAARDAEAAGQLHARGHAGHGRADAVHLAGGRRRRRRGVIELLLVNHPLDCPVCDKGGECPLQNQAMSNGAPISRFQEKKRTFPKPIRISTAGAARPRALRPVPALHPVLQGDRRRPVHRPAEPRRRPADRRLLAGVLGFATTVVTEGGSAVDESGQPFASYFSGNTVQICPVGALTGAAYRFRARPFDLVSTRGVCEHCASGCGLRVDHRRGVVMRRLALEDPAVNEDWNCDKGRWAFTWQTAADRLEQPLVRDEETGELRVGLLARGAGRRRARAWPRPGTAGGVGVLAGGRLTVEDAYAYAQVRPGRARHQRRRLPRPPALGRGGGVPRARRRGRRARGHVRRPRGRAGRAPRGPRARGGVADPLPAAAQGVPPRGSACTPSRPTRRRGLAKLGGRLVPAAPGTEAEVLDAIGAGDPTTVRESARPRACAPRRRRCSSASAWPRCPAR